MEIKLESFDFETITFIDRNGETKVHNVKELLKISPYNVMEEYLNQPAEYVYWSSMLELIGTHLDSKKFDLEKFMARERINARELLKAAKPNIQQIEDHVISLPDYTTYKEAVKSFQHYYSQIQRVVKAFEQRKDMLIQIGAQQRKDNQYGGNNPMIDPNA